MRSVVRGSTWWTSATAHPDPDGPGLPRGPPTDATTASKHTVQHLRTALILHDPGYRREGAQSDIELANIYLRQDQPEVDHAVSLTTRAVETLSGEVASTRCID